jgi:hypothetical protein
VHERGGSSGSRAAAPGGHQSVGVYGGGTGSADAMRPATAPHVLGAWPQRAGAARQHAAGAAPGGASGSSGGHAAAGAHGGWDARPASPAALPAPSQQQGQAIFLATTARQIQRDRRSTQGE